MVVRGYLWREYKQQHPDGYVYSQFNHHLSVWTNRLKGSTRLMHKLCDRLYMSISVARSCFMLIRLRDKVVNSEVLVCILPASQYTFIIAIRSQKVEDLVRV